MHGLCRLCKVARELRASHILSRWVYRRVVHFGSGPAGTTASVPLQIEGEVARYTASQPTEYLLCGDCEQRFSRWEDHVARLARQTNGMLPALKAVILRRHRVPRVECEADGSGLGIETARFAASVVWRASVGTMYQDVDLGPYQDRFRDFLAGRTSVIEGACLVVQVVDQQMGGVDMLASPPYSWNEHGWREHQFAVPGIVFTFSVGNRMPKRFEDFCFVRTRRAWVIDGLDMAAAVRKKMERLARLPAPLRV